MEIWDIYAIDRAKTGRTMIRGTKLKENDYHLVVHICIFNSKNEMLIQQRQSFKLGWPNLWDLTVGGNAISGDTSQTAAEREMKEELGYHIDLNGIRPHLTINFDVGFDDYYLIDQDIDITTLTLQKEEVQAVKWASLETILKMKQEQKFIPYHSSFIELLFNIRKNYGCIIE